MKTAGQKNIILFIIVVIFAVAAFGAMLYQGLRPFFISAKFSWLAWPTSAPKTSGKARLLDGVYLAQGESEKYPVAVVMDNKYEARPWSGLSSAGVVFEAPVEGGITRFLAIYSTPKEIKKIGPVRSIRSYFVDWAVGFSAVTAHVGGSPTAMSAIYGDDGASKLDLDEYYNSHYFWRSSDRIAPHNLYTSSGMLDKARIAKSVQKDMNFSPWKFKNDAFVSERGGAREINIDLSLYSDYDAIWEYDKDKNLYKRKFKSGYAQDDNNALILAKNIAVLETDIWIIDALSRRKIITVGNGNAVIFQDGRKIEGSWEKKSQSTMLRFYNASGKEIEFNRGTTWIEAVASLSAVAER